MKKLRLASIAMSIVLVLAQLMLVIIPVSAADPAPVTESTAPLFADTFQFFLPEADAKNYINTCAKAGGVVNGVVPVAGAHVSGFYNGTETYFNLEVSAATSAYLSYKVKNNADVAVAIASGVYFATTSKNLGAAVMVPMVYDATTGARLDLKTSDTYATPLSAVWGQPMVEIPANTEVYVVVPLSSIDDATKYIPGIAYATGDTFAGKGQISQKGVLYSSNADRTGWAQDYVNAKGAAHIKQIQMFVLGNADATNNTMVAKGNFDLTISGVYVTTKEEYNAKYAAANFAMNGGAVRMNQETGIRFASTLSKNYYNYLTETYGEENVTFGTIITPEHYATAAGAMTFAALDALDTAVYGATKYLNVTADGFYKETETQAQIVGSLVGIKETHYDWNYTAVSYVKIVDGENVMYVYADNAVSRSIAGVAKDAVNDRMQEQATGYGYEINDGNANGKWSPYTTTQIDLLKGFYA